MIGAASSIPQYNIKELNNALIKLLWNPDIDFDEIYCAPDFATGAILLNEDEVKESMRAGHGKACKLRSVVEFDSKERCLIVTEIPYSVYTNTICGELEAILESEDNPGVDRFNDLTGETPLIKIYLTKKANPDKVLKYLYRNTSLQYYYGINMTMLENGRFPRVYTWKEALAAHLEHEKEVYIRGYKYDLAKIEARLHIIEGLLKAINMIDEVITTIKSAANTPEANNKLCVLLSIDSDQAKAILDIKLSRLARLEINKLIDEQKSLNEEREKIQEILDNRDLLYKEIEKGLLAVANKYGDARRTKIINIGSEEDEPTEVRSLLINLTNENNLFVSEASSLYTQRRGGVGSKFKLNDGEFVISTTTTTTSDVMLFFTQIGNVYHYNAGALPIDEKINIESLFTIKPYERVCAFTSADKNPSKQNIIILTKKGLLKKSLISEYNTKRAGGIKALELDSGDEVVSVVFTNEERIGILTEFGQFLICETKDVRAIGRVTRGVKAIKLAEDDNVVSARIIPPYTKEYVSITGDGYIKRTPASDFVVTGRNTKGAKLHKLKEDTDFLIDFMPIIDEKEIIVVSTRAHLKTSVNEITLASKNAQGTKSIKLGAKDNIIGLSKF